MKLIFLIVMVSNIFANQDAKLILIQNDVYSKIKNLNLLNDGIKKNYLISSTNLNTSDLEELYPEYFIYNGENCNLINKVSITDLNTLKSDVQVKTIFSKKDLVKEIKLLQILYDYENNKNLLDNDLKNIILSLGIICNNKLVLHNKEYIIGDTINNNKINLIDKNKSILYLIKGN